MKMPKEYVLVLIIGLFLLAYLLEAVVDPLTISITSPYQYVTLGHWSRLPFTTAIITIRSLAVIMAPLWLLSFISGAFQYPCRALPTLHKKAEPDFDVFEHLTDIYGAKDYTSSAFVEG